MGYKTGIPWTQGTWNPVSGCTYASTGCQNCYAKRDHDMRHNAYIAGKQMPECYSQGFHKVRFYPKRMKQITPSQAPRTYFVCSTGDLFHEQVKFQWTYEIFEKMQECHQHKFLLLTKRTCVMQKALENVYYHLLGVGKYDSQKKYLKNVWLGATVESDEQLYRIKELLKTPAEKHFISVEPMLSGINIPIEQLQKLDWVIIGCESGKYSRKCQDTWVNNLIQQCLSFDIPVFLKQLEISGKLIKEPEFMGKKYQQYPNERKDNNGKNTDNI